jgi:hypothetical protein
VRQATVHFYVCFPHISLTPPAFAATVSFPHLVSIDMNGPFLPFIGPSSAAVQLHQTGHSYIV